MSGIIVIRAQVKNDCMLQFIDVLSNRSFTITKIYKGNRTTEFIFAGELMSYGEPSALYDEAKDFVTDVWYAPVGDSLLKPGKSNSLIHWQSCKEENG